MKRMTKNILLCVVIIIAILGICFTLYYAKNNLTSNEIEEVVGDFGNTDSDGMKGGRGSSDSSELPDSGELPDMDGDLDASDIDSDDTSSRGKPSDVGGEMPDGEKADGGFAGAGTETLNETNLSLTIGYIIIIGICSLVISICLLYLIMSGFNSRKAFPDNSKIIIFIMANIILTVIITVAVVLFANNIYLNEETSSDVEYSSPDDLNIDMTNWSYDSSNNVYYQIGLVYVSNPVDVEFESMGIYVPGDYMDCEKNGDNYTCVLNTENKVGNYTSENAPIVMPVNTAGYSEQAAPTNYSYNGLEDYLEAGFIYVYAGCRGRNNGDDYDGGAPWGVTDLKAAIRYLRYNEEDLPGDTESIFVFGHSGGGAQSTLLGTTGDSELYTPYLEEIGALMNDDEGNEISDAVAGVMAWCPITSLDYANEAYEWNMGQFSTTGTRASTTWTSALSLDLAEAYAKYINKLKLVDNDGNVLKLSSTTEGVYTSGTYYDYLLGVIEESLTNYLNDNYSSVSEMQEYVDSLNSDEEWVVFNSSKKSVSISSIESFVTHCKSASKDVGAFDDLNRSQAENAVFGNSENDYLHWDKVMANLLSTNASKYAVYSDYDDSYIEEYANDLEEVDALGNDTTYRQNMYNPMYYLTDYYDGYETSSVANYWRIRTGITQGDTALTVETNLALALNNYSSVLSVDFATVWNQGHTTAERTGDSTENFISWVNECLN